MNLAGHADQIADVCLVEPSLERLPAYVAALEAGWSPSTLRDVSGAELASIRTDATAFLRLLRGESSGTVTLADGSERPRLPGRTLWIWDGEFCGSINVRFVPGTEELPPHVTGHVGFAVVPWKRRRGYATRALALLLPIARGLGLARVLITCDEDNIASRRVIEANRGVLAGDMAGNVASDMQDSDNPDKRSLRFWVSTGDAVAD